MLASLRAHALSHPLVLFLLCLAVFKLLGPVLRRLPEKLTYASRAMVPATCLLVFLYLATVIVYVVTPAYFDHVEPSVAAVSWVVMQGQQAYPDQAGAGIYGLPYGPMLFLCNGLTMLLLGPGITTSKIAGAGASVASLFALVIALRQAQGDPEQGRRVATHRSNGPEWPRAMRWAAVVYLMFGATSFWVRAEPLLLFCSSLAVLSLTMPALMSAVLAGIAVGVGVNLKVSAIIYLFPALALVWRKHGPGRFAAAAAIATLVAALPYLAFHNVSLAGYLAWVQAATGQGVRLWALPTALEWTIFLTVPIVLSGRSETAPCGVSDMVVFRALVIASMLVSLPLAAKHGTGIYHFLPFVPSIIFASCTGTRTGPLFLAPAMLASFVLVAALQLQPWVTATTSLPAREIISELKQIEAAHAGSLAMGYSANYRLSFFRPVLVFEGQPYSLDGASLMDWHWSGRPFPSAAVAAVRACAVDAWIIPAGAPPFELPNAYPISGDVFPDEFRRAFKDRYALERSGRWFDVWRCQR